MGVSVRCLRPPPRGGVTRGRGRGSSRPSRVHSYTVTVRSPALQNPVSTTLESDFPVSGREDFGRRLPFHHPPSLVSPYPGSRVKGRTGRPQKVVPFLTVVPSTITRPLVPRRDPFKKRYVPNTQSTGPNTHGKKKLKKWTF